MLLTPRVPVLPVFGGLAGHLTEVDGVLNDSHERREG